MKKIFQKCGLNFARCLGSKSRYKETHPNHLIIFNARIYLKHYYEREKDKAIRDFFAGQKAEIWYGDLDLNIDIYKLWKAYLEIKQPLVITTEMGSKIIEIGDRIGRQWIGYYITKSGKKQGITP